MELLKLLSANEIVAQIVSFLIFLTIMRVFLWKKFLGVLDRRREAISDEYKRIEEAKEAVTRQKDEYAARLAGIDSDRKMLIKEAMVEARRVGDELRSSAEREGERILENAKANLKDEVEKAKEDLKGSIVDLTIKIAEKVIQEKLSEVSDRRLVENFIEGIGKK